MGIYCSNSNLTPDSFPMRTARFSFAACDLDRTILHDGKLVLENVKAVKALEQRGVKVLLATGRNFHQAIKFHQALKLSTPLITSDGALVSSPGRSGGILREKVLPEPLFDYLVTEAERRQISCLCFFKHGIYVTSKFDWSEELQRHDELGRRFRRSSYTAMRKHPVYKVYLFSQNDQKLTQLKADLEALFPSEFESFDYGFSLEIVPKNVNKSSALSWLAQELQLCPDQFIAFGDGVNDAKMLSWAGLGICMNHGHPAAKASANLIAPPTIPSVNFAEAVADVISRGLLYSDFDLDSTRTDCEQFCSARL